MGYDALDGVPPSHAIIDCSLTATVLISFTSMPVGSRSCKALVSCASAFCTHAPSMSGMTETARVAADTVTEILTRCRTIAVVGLSSMPGPPPPRMRVYMREQGYRVISVNPREVRAFDEPVCPVSRRYRNPSIL